MTDPTVFEGTIVTRLAAFARHLGLDPYALATRAGLRRDDVDDPTRLQRIDEVARLYRELAEATGDEAVGLRVAAHSALRDYGLMGLIFAHSPTVGASLDHLARVFTALLAHAELRVTGEGRLVRLSMSFEFDHPGLAQLRQDTLSAVFLHLQRRAGPDFRPVAVKLHQLARDRAPFDDFFGVAVQFGATADEVLFAAEALDAPVPGHDPLVLHHLLASVEVHLARRRAAANRSSRLLRLRGCVVDMESGTVTRGEPGPDRAPAPARHPRGVTVLHLTSRERELLEYFARRKNEVVTHDDLERDVWQLGRAVISHAPAVAIRRLRAKIEPAGRRPMNLLTVFGEGWKLVVTEGPEADAAPPAR
jgi:hypothetical protein